MKIRSVDLKLLHANRQTDMANLIGAFLQLVSGERVKNPVSYMDIQIV
jgi:hypothetical protein